MLDNMDSRQGVTNARGFTLIEILVVISIIVLLIALALPALRQARESAKGLACLSQMRSIMYAVTFYIEDSNDYILPAYQNTAAPGYLSIQRYWSSRLAWAGYLDWGPMYFCPTVEANADLTPYSSRMNAYGMRVWYSPGTTNNPDHPKRQIEIDLPSEFFLFADSYYPVVSRGWYRHYPSVSQPSVYFPHVSSGNTVFADLHGQRIGDANYFQQQVPQKQGRYSNDVPYYVSGSQ